MTDTQASTGNGTTQRTSVPAGESKRERTARIIDRRTNQAIKAIRLIAGMGGSNRYSYDWGEADIDKVRSALMNEVAEMTVKLKRPAKQLPLFSLEGTGEVE